MPKNINVAFINSANYSLYANKTVTLTSRWEQYNLGLAVPSDAMASFNLDVGGTIGRYYFDEIVLTTLEADSSNPVVNGERGYPCNASAPYISWFLSTISR